MSAPAGSGKGGGRELKANPFGNYSLREAQQPTRSSNSNSLGSSVPDYARSEGESQSLSEPHQLYGYPINASHRHIQQHRSMQSAGSTTDDSRAGYIRSMPADELGGDYLPAPALPESYDSYDGMGASQANQGGASIEQYAIRMLYEEFRDRAARKIDDIIELRLDREPDLTKHLELGADVIFDRTLEKLGMLARRRPRVIIELLLVWRKTTIDAADEYPLEGVGLANGSRQQPPQAALSRAHHIVKERKSLASVYILCRALSAVVEQLEASHLEGDLGDRLEELVFGQVKQVNPANLRRSHNRRQIQELYARLIGQISDIRFASMSDRFIAELERIPMVSSGSDERIVVLLHNMRFLRLRVFPIDALEESSAFLLSCAKFYSRTSGSLRLKHAWATLLTELLMPMAAVVDVEVNLPELVQALDIIFAKAMKMAPKVRHVHVAFPLAAATLCISRRDVFHQRWLSLLEYCIQRLKDKQFRRVSMDAILRMLWVYLFRYPESSAVVTRRIDSLSRIFFPATKLHAWPKTVPPSAFVYFLVCAACYNFDFAMRQLLLNMLQTDSGWPGTTRELSEIGPILDSLNPARVGLAYQALVAIAAIASNRASLGAVGGGPSGGGDNVGGGSGPSANTGSTGGSLASMHPPFPGVAQLSGLDYFSLDSPPRSSANTSGAGGCSSGLTATGGARKAVQDSASSRDRQPPINPAVLPDNIRNALVTAINVVQRYFNALCPIFGQYVLADERLWRLTRTVPPFSSAVLTGSTFSFENTAAFSALALQGIGGSGGTSGLGALNGSESGAGTTSGGPLVNATLSIADNTIDGAGGNGAPLSGASGTLLLDVNGGDGSSSYAVVSGIRQAVTRYPVERQVYVDLMAVYTHNMPRVQTLWGPCDRRKVVETMVQNTLSVDQALAAASRACLLDLLCPLVGQLRDGERMFGSQAERLDGVVQAVTRATRLLRAVDERFSEILVGGIFSRDARSSMSFAQPGDSLVDGPGTWPYCQQMHPHRHGTRRFMHTANLSSASTTSNHYGNDVGRVVGGAVSDSECRYDDTSGRHGYSMSVGKVNDDCHSDADTDSSSAAVMAAALDAKSRMERLALSSVAHSSPLSSMDPTARELDGGFLHFFKDLMHYLEVLLCEYQAEEDTEAASSGALADQTSAAQVSTVSLPESETGGSGYVGDGIANATDLRTVGGRSLVEWAKLVHAIEANAVALLCSSSVRVRHLAVDVLYQAGVLRRILGASESLPLAGQAWTFRGASSAYEILNVPVPLKMPDAGTRAVAGKIAALGGGSLVGDLWDVPFEAAEAPSSQQNQPQQALARVAASSAAADMALWIAYLPQFVGRAIVLMPEVMLVSRTLVCQRLYQMQPLMSQYADVSVRSGGLQHGTLYVRASGVRTHAAGSSSSSSSSVVLRADLISTFNSLFLFAVVSLPAGGGLGSASGFGGSGGLGSGSYGETVIGSRSPRSGASNSSGAFSNSRLAKSIARKLAPLKASSRGNKQEHGVGLASISQLVRMAGVLLRSDNAPLRQSAALALCHTPAAYLVELMQELRPLAESLFDDGSSLGSHRHYLHVSGASSSPAGGGGRDGLLGALGHHGLSSSPGLLALSASGDSPKPQMAQQVHKAGSSLLAAAQIAPHSSSKRGSSRAAAARATSAAPGSDTEATSDSGNNGGRTKSGSSRDVDHSSAQGRRASSFDATAMTTSSVLGSTTTGGGLRRPLEASAASANSAVAVANAAAANAAANAAAIAAVSGGSGSTSQMRRKRLRLSLAQIYRQVSRQLEAEDPDDMVLGQLISYVRETKTFLSETSVQWEAEHQSLRIHFCGLVEALYYCISAPTLRLTSVAGGDGTAKHKFTYETRNGLYQLFERWCGLGRHADSGRETHARMAAAVLDQVKDPAERVLVAEKLESDFLLLELMSLRAMAVLCRDAVQYHVVPNYSDSASVGTAGSGPRDKAALFAWVSDALDHNDTRVQRVGQRAVEWAVIADPKDSMMVRVLIQLSYGLSVASSVNNGFAAVERGPNSVDSPRVGGGTSGLGLMFVGSSNEGAPPSTTGGYTLRHYHSTVGSPGGAGPVLLSTDRIALGYLRALTSILLAPASYSIGAGKALTLTYASLILPLVMFHLRSERHRIRRQALLLLRVLCSHMSTCSCLAKVDELGPSIVSDIPAIAADAATRLTTAVASSFVAHSEMVILECVRQVHAQGAIVGRLAALLEILRPWVSNIELRHVAGDGSDGLGPVALSRDSLVVLRCLLYLTVKAGLDVMPGIQELWMALVCGDHAHEANMWLAMRYLTGLLIHTQSLALLGYMRRIAVFMTRSSAQGKQLVQRLVDEIRRPAAAIPVEADNIVAHNSINEVLPNEAWTGEFVFSPRRSRVLVSTAALAMFYLAAVSYEQPALVADHDDLAVLPPALFALANPERWVRDAARTVLVNLVAAERAWCSIGASGHLEADVAHTVLSVLRGDDCATGFGNVEDAGDDVELRKKPGMSPDNYALNHAWSPMAASLRDVAANAGEQPVGDAMDEPEPKVDVSDVSDVPEEGREPANIDVADPSVVADVADVSASLLPTPQPQVMQGPPGFPQRSLSIDYQQDTSGSIIGGSSGAGRERAVLQRFVVQLSRLFHRRRPGCAQEWANVAVRWAMSCPVRPLAALALQIFSVLAMEAQYGGTLVITPTRPMILHLIDRLSNVVGDPSADLAAFAETVLGALRQTAALAARMCAEDVDIRSDLLAASMVLMATAQSASVYTMAVSVFERVFPLVEDNEPYFRGLVLERVGALSSAMSVTGNGAGYQLALLRGLEFAPCRERCLRLLRDTLKYDMDAGGCAHPMLAITAHLPALIEDVIADVALLQSTHSPSADLQPRESQGSEDSNSPATGGHRHGARKHRAPGFSASAPGSSLGLMFASAPVAAPGLLHSSNVALRGGPAHQPQQTSPRRQLFRRRGANSNNNLADAAAGVGASPERSPEPNGTANTSRDSLLPPEATKVSAPSIGRTSSTTSQHVAEDLGTLMRDKYVAFVSECSQILLLGQQTMMQNQKSSQEMRVFVQRLLTLLAAPAASAHDSANAPSLQHTVSAAREVMKQFGYAAVECGRAVDVIAVLLRLLQPSSRMRVALKYLRDEQARTIVNEHRRNQMGHSQHGPAAEEVRKIDGALRLLQSVLVASSDSASGNGRSQALLRVDSALMPSLRHLFGLLIVARPISDTASQVLMLLLQRFDDPALGDAGFAAHGVYSAFKWYETDSHALHGSARAALSRIVALGIKDSGSDGEEALGCRARLADSPASASRSVTPEMPVLVLDGELSREYQLSAVRLLESDGDGLSEHGLDGGPFFYGASGGSVAESDNYLGVPSDTGPMSDDDEDMLAQLDMFDKELDEALRA
ncbi:Cell morphogenesis protein PAG1 [Coemansia sp. BCRC 34962]|nr:Cell morphogenesis protein PAG1 [Coemansia sp. BCRC 34962]